jgi:hypothetical protein
VSLCNGPHRLSVCLSIRNLNVEFFSEPIWCTLTKLTIMVYFDDTSKIISGLITYLQGQGHRVKKGC